MISTQRLEWEGESGRQKNNVKREKKEEDYDAGVSFELLSSNLPGGNFSQSILAW